MHSHVRRIKVCLCGLLLVFQSVSVGNQDGRAALRTVGFGMLPYADHTYAIIGVKQGWFKDVGIELKYEGVKVEEIIPFLKNGTLDVVSCPPGVLFSSYDNAPNLVSFVFGDLFQGYAIMAQPGSGVKSYENFLKNGLEANAAIRATAQQLKGKVFAYPTESAIKPFIDLILEKGGLARRDFKSLVLDDPLTVNAMRSKQADFQVGGVPSRIVLEREGFTPIIKAVDLVQGAKPSPESKELASILQNGWATTREYYQKEHDTVLRLASVNYRIMKFINTNTQKAIALHIPYLNQITGERFTARDGQIIYTSLDPFITFENQRGWFHDSDSPLFYSYVNGAILKSFVDQGVYKGKPPGVEDVIYADDVYRELEKFRDSAEQLFKTVDVEQLAGKGDELMKKYKKAKWYYEIYNFFDADRLAKEIVTRRGNDSSAKAQ